MAVLRIVRFTTDPAHAEEMLQTRAGLVAATRQRFTGLTGTRLVRVDEATWIDHWQWESAEDMQRALDNVATIPGAQAAFSLIAEPSFEVAEIVDDGTEESADEASATG